MGRKNCLPLKVQGALQATVHLWAWPYRRPVLLSKKKGTQQGCATGEGALQRGCATGALPLYYLDTVSLLPGNIGVLPGVSKKLVHLGILYCIAFPSAPVFLRHPVLQQVCFKITKVRAIVYYNTI